MVHKIIFRYLQLHNVLCEFSKKNGRHSLDNKQIAKE